MTSVALNGSPTELTTAATDLALALACLAALWRLLRLRVSAPWKRSLWVAVLALLSVAAGIGAAMHGLAWTDSVRLAFRHPVFVLLGLSVMLFLTGAIYDWRGEAAARRALPWSIAVAVQTSRLSIHLFVPLDRNGLFHLIQLVAAIMLATGLRRGLAAP